MTDTIYKYDGNQQMNLGDLEFKAEDFTVGFQKETQVYLASLANRILREKLEKAPKLFGEKISLLYEDENLIPRKAWSWIEEPELFEYRKNSKTARLVCIEEIK